ncbi:MAG: 50S ribosomal protein L11 methyltransferase, partial [Clostridiales Family XIII bacterium]|nr:50S ribosomal protein L11 methyltransferase [Clostridiales Family XIII bacterium]
MREKPEARETLAFVETRIHTTTNGVEPITALLLKHGVSGAAVEDGADIRAVSAGKDVCDWDYIDPSLLQQSQFGEEAVVLFYTPDDEAGRELLSSVRIDLLKLKNDEQCGLYGESADFGRVYAESMPLSNEWREQWREGFKPFHVTDRFVVCPPWEDCPGGGTCIVIDPGMAFGTGSHETTAMCIRALEEVLRSGDAVLDIGTGSGILSVAAVLLGAGRVTAVEIDADAVCAAGLNFERNGVAASVTLIEGDIRHVDDAAIEGAEKIGGGYDVAVANLVSGLIATILPAVAARLTRSGRLILSGLLDVEHDAMCERLSSAGFFVEKTVT